MEPVRTLDNFADERGNRIEYSGDAPHEGTVSITFRGANNVLRVAARPRMSKLHVVFDCDNGEMEIGAGGGHLSLSARVGQDSRILIGAGTTSTDVVILSATEGTTIKVGPDVMFASQNQVRADDGHPIFDVRSGKRVNVSRDITIGAHVWLGWGAYVLGGSTVGEGSVLGMGAILKGRVPNNAIAVGSPARVVKRDIAWERPHLSLVEPFYKPDASTIKRSKYWKLSADSPARRAVTPRRPLLLTRIVRRVKRVLGR